MFANVSFLHVFSVAQPRVLWSVLNGSAVIHISCCATLAFVNTHLHAYSYSAPIAQARGYPAKNLYKKVRFYMLLIPDIEPQKSLQAID